MEKDLFNYIKYVTDPLNPEEWTNPVLGHQTKIRGSMDTSKRPTHTVIDDPLDQPDIPL